MSLCCFHRNQTGIKHWQLSDKDGKYYWGTSSSFHTLESFVEVGWTCTVYMHIFHPSSQGWAPKCTIHFVFVCLFVCILRVQFVGSGFPSFHLFLYNYLSYMYVVCYTRIHFHVYVDVWYFA